MKEGSKIKIKKENKKKGKKKKKGQHGYEAPKEYKKCTKLK